MTYETYETEAFVISARDVKEGNRIFNLFTNEFGLVWALAQNVRADKSKIRYNLQVLSKTEVSLVRGREYWRVVGAKNADNLFSEFKNSQENTKLLARFFSLLSRLVQGEGKNAYLFATLDGIIEELRSTKVPSQTLKHLELLTVSRMLQALGYFSEPTRYKKFFVDTRFDSKTLDDVASLESELLADINLALHESHL